MSGKHIGFRASPYMDKIIDNMQVETGLKGGDNIQYLILRATGDFLRQKAGYVQNAILNKAFGYDEENPVILHDKIIQDTDFSDLEHDEHITAIELAASFSCAVEEEFYDKVGIDLLVDWKGEKNDEYREDIVIAHRNAIRNGDNELKRIERFAIIAETKSATKGWKPEQGKRSGAEYIFCYLNAYSMIKTEVYPEQVAKRAAANTRRASVIFK